MWSVGDDERCFVDLADVTLRLTTKYGEGRVEVCDSRSERSWNAAVSDAAVSDAAVSGAFSAIEETTSSVAVAVTGDGTGIKPLLKLECEQRTRQYTTVVKKDAMKWEYVPESLRNYMREWMQSDSNASALKHLLDVARRLDAQLRTPRDACMWLQHMIDHPSDVDLWIRAIDDESLTVR